jgi:DNA (cytosine-5)-methyltransferase 1
MKHGSLFSGIGGFDLAAQWAGWENVFHCEWNPFGQQVLKHYWPNAESFNDINTSDFSKYANQLDILTGGFPCQPFSTAGKRQGKNDSRHLWPRMLEVISTIKPRWVVGENVYGLLNWSGGLVFQEIITDLENQGYEVQSFLLPAAGVGAPHKRYRIWIVAYTNSNGLNWGERIYEKYTGETRINALHDIKQAFTSNTESIRRENALENSELERRRFRKQNKSSTWSTFPLESPVCGGDDGLPTELDGITFSKWRSESVKAYGNAIVPQVAYQIFKAINEYERSR